jgi:hypothetical protein
VSTVTVDAAAKTAAAVRASVSGVEAHNGALEWRETEEALPLPLNFRDASTHFLLQISDLSANDREMLTVANLGGAKYRLVIDTVDVGTFSAAELAAGVNLSSRSSPMTTQALSVDEINLSRIGIDGMRRQMLLQGKDMKDQAAGVKAMDDFDETKWREQKKKATPVQHVFHLIPVADAP